MIYVVARNMSIRHFIPIQGTFPIYEPDLTNYNINWRSLRVRKVVYVPESPLLNGMTILHACEGLLLIGDPVLGVVWRLNVKTGEYAQVIDLPIMKSIPGSIPTCQMDWCLIVQALLRRLISP
jgi:hypothetical protein